VNEGERARRPLVVANCSGFLGDRIAAAREVLAGPSPIDVLTGDYLAELTMLILWKARQKDPALGYATTFLRQMEDVLGTCLDRGTKVVANAGGLNPHGLADALRALGDRLGLAPAIAVVDGDDLVDRLADLQDAGEELVHLDTGRPLRAAGAVPVTANAYLGAWGIADALAAGADVVVCPRVTDASLVVGPAAWWHGWGRTDWDRLAGAVVVGHVLECGPQATGGNHPFLDELPDDRYPGFPLAEVAHDGSCVITKQPGSGGAVTVGTVTGQLLYEIAEPAYAGPDVVARFDTVGLELDGPDRVRIHGVRGEPPSDRLKVAINLPGGFRNSMTMVITGLDVERKAARAEAMLWDVLGGREQFGAVDVQLLRTDQPDAPTNAQAAALLRVTVKDPDASKVGRRFANAVVELSLASYAGFHTTTPPSAETAYGVYWPALVPAAAVEHTVTRPDGTRVVIPHTAGAAVAAPVEAPPPPSRWAHGGATARMPLGTVCGARSGDKGGNANVGVWARTDASHRWLVSFLTVERFRELLPEAAPLDVRRFELPTLLALNFVVVGILGEGVASSTRPDPQAKGLGEWLRSRLVDVPLSLLPDGT
jgi:hypothetical protein